MNLEPEASNLNLSQLRDNMDMLDKDLLNTLLQRFKLVESIAKVKTTQNNTQTLSYAPDREREILKNLHALSNNQPENSYIDNIYQAIFSATRRIQKEYKIGVHQIEKGHTLTAAIIHFGDYHQYDLCEDLEQLISELEDKTYDYIVVGKEAQNIASLKHCYDVTLHAINASFSVLTTNPGNT